MKNKCKICGNPCRSKYCSDECRKEQARIQSRNKYRKNHTVCESFYVFYDRDDFVKFFGTREQLIEDGTFPNRNAFYSAVSKIKKGIYGNTKVHIFKFKKERE